MPPEASLAASSTKKIIPIVPYGVKGRYRNIKSLVLLIAYAVYFSMPWLAWHGDQRVGQPVLIDLATLRVNFFDLVIFPHDLIILVGILILAVVLLFMAASLYGRMFCGFFCFQTLWTDAFRFIERLVQGEAPARIRLRKQPWTPEKIAKLVLTHGLWLLLSFATALTFALYFIEAPVLFAKIFNGSAPIAAYTTVVVLTATTYVAAGLAREQVCLVACPYGKFQTAMQDAGTMTVVYDQQRGERTLGCATPRAELKQAAVRAEKGYGDCIACNYCVNVCPTGVDIRKGFQIDCISCGLCVDACDTIMDSVSLPRGLIRFDRAQTATSRRRFNVKTAGYSTVLAGMLGFVIYTANTLTPFDATVQHHAQPLVTRLSNGDLKNRYIVRITNKTTAKAHYILHVEGLPAESLSGATQLAVPAGKTYTQTFNIVLPERTAQATEKFKLILMQQGHPQGTKSFHLSYYAGV
jgi:cytochrome c oxidase accessory protein FixG